MKNLKSTLKLAQKLAQKLNCRPQLLQHALTLGAVSLATSAMATLPPVHLAQLQKDSNAIAAKVRTIPHKNAKKKPPLPRMVKADDLSGDAQALEDRMEFEAMQTGIGDGPSSGALTGTLALQNGLKVNRQLNSLQTILRAWQPMSSPNLPTISAAKR